MFPRTAMTGAIFDSLSKTVSSPISPACMMKSTFLKAFGTPDGNRPWVSEITPIE
jgi:hypothetical protein